MSAKVIITPLFGIGDTLMTTPALRVLKESRPDLEVHYFVMKKSIYELLRTNPYIDRLVYFPMMEAGRLRSLIFLLKNVAFRYDYSLTFYPSNRKDYNLFAFLTFAKERIGHRYRVCDLRELNWLKNRTLMEEELHNVEENIRLLRFLGIDEVKEIPAMDVFLTPEEVMQGKEEVKRLGGRVKVGMHLGSDPFKNHANKRLPKEKFLEAVNSFPDFSFILFGTQLEKEENEFLLKNARHGNVILMEGRGIRQVASVIKALDLFISNDSGLMHLAAAVGTPVVAVFGPTNPKHTYPWKVKHRIVSLNLSCSPCFRYSPRPLSCKEGINFRCVKDIPASAVCRAVEELLQEIK